MKREIVCDECERSWRLSVAEARSDPQARAEMEASGEGTKIVGGRLHRTVRCDGCGKVLANGVEAHAVSNYNSAAPYLPWEREFLS